MKVLLDGLYDPESSLNRVNRPMVKRAVMEVIWGEVIRDWQVTFRHLLLSILCLLLGL